MADIKAAIKKLWTDSVVSKILGSVGYAALVSVAAYIAPRHVLEHRTFALAATVLIAVEGFALFVALRRTSAVIAPEARAGYYYRATPRRWATGFAYSMPILLPLITFGIEYTRCHVDQRTAVYVTRFESKNGDESYRLTRSIFERLRNSLSKYSDIHPELLSSTVPWHGDDASVILNWCQKQRASILIWGDFDKTQQIAVVNTHIQLIRPTNSLRG